MLCRRCRHQIARHATVCPCCGAGRPRYDLVLPEGARVALVGELSIGRGAHCALRIDDPSVSRLHARVTTPATGGPRIEDAGSTHGTYVDGQRVRSAPLTAGTRIRIGATRVTVAARAPSAGNGNGTMIVRPGETVIVGAAAQGPQAISAPVPAARPRLRSGWALKRLAGGRAVLKDLRTDRFLRLDDADASLLVLLDGRRTLERLALKAEAVAGPEGPGRMIMLLADLADRGLVSGIAGTEPEERPTRLARLLRPRVRAWKGAGAALERVYRAGGWLLFTRSALTALALIAVAGPAAFVAALLEGGRTPFVVGGHLTVGSAVFLAGRFAVAGVHELAHGLTITSFGRRIHRAGAKLVLVFPYLFVDTSDAWFEGRRRRIAIAAAGPVSDLALAGACGIVALASAGLAGEIAFQLASGAYLGALYNLNPLLERDGYHMLADALGQPALRARARRRLAALLAGRAQPDRDARVLTLYAVAALGWTLVAAGLMVAGSQHLRGALEVHLPGPAVWALLAPVYVAALIPVALAVAGPLLARRRRG